MTKDLALKALANGESQEVAVIEAEARETFNAATYSAQVAWHNSNEKLHREFQDNIEDNNARYRDALTKAQRAYRDATSDVYAG